MNLNARISKLEANTTEGATVTIWADGKTEEQLSAEIAERTEGDPSRRVILVGWQKPDGVGANLPKSATFVSTGVPRSC